VFYVEFFEKEEPVSPFIRVSASSLKRFACEVFRALGVREGDASVAADVLVTADLMGISSHGVQRLGRYVAGIESGAINVNPEMRLVVDSYAVGVLDADNGLGQVAAYKAMVKAVEKARQFGVGIVLVRRSHHFGIAGYYALKAVENSMIGVTMTNTTPLVAYIGTVERYLGTNAIAFAAPRKQPPPLLFDGALSVAPVGRLELYSKIGREVSAGWVIGIDGEVLRGDARKIYEALTKGLVALLPLGGYSEELGGHKGSGLALVIDVICGILSGASWGHHVKYTTTKNANVGHALIAIDISKFMKLEEFCERLEQMISEIKALKKAPWVKNIWIPGERSWLTMQTRLRIGIPLHITVVEELRNIAKKASVKFDVEFL
jgi:LDH2 family malate/lactate/ureidoglycolate dehydrogenase